MIELATYLRVGAAHCHLGARWYHGGLNLCSSWRPECLQSLPLDCLGLAKAAALVRIGAEQTALALTLGPSQPDTMLPPGVFVQGEAYRQEDAIAGEVAMHDAVRAAMSAAEAAGRTHGVAKRICLYAHVCGLWGQECHSEHRLKPLHHLHSCYAQRNPRSHVLLTHACSSKIE